MRPIVAALAAFFLALLSFETRAATFKIATAAPDGTSWMKALRAGAEEIEKRTFGRVTFRFYPGGIMGNDASVLRKIRVGQLNGGMITGGGLAEIYSDAQVYTLPLAFRSFEEVDFVRERMDQLVIDGIGRNGFTSFGLSEGGFAYLMSNAPLKSVDDLKGQKVWVPEGDVIGRSAFEALHVHPVSLPLTDVLTGLQTGMIDTVGTSPIGAIALQWHIRVKYLTDTPLLYLYGTLIVQRKVFEGLSAEDRAVVREVMGEVFARFDRENRRDNEQALKALRNQGIEFVSPSEDQSLRWESTMETVTERLVMQGVLSAGIVKTFRSHLNEFRKRDTPR